MNSPITADMTEVDFSIRRYRARFCTERFFRIQLSDCAWHGSDLSN
jgi:hypothetical protein